MVNTLLESVRREEAEIACDLGYLMEEMEDEDIDAAFAILEAGEVKESSVDYDIEDEDVKEMMEHMDEIPDEHEEEIRRIMETTEGLSFEQMIGLEPINESAEEE